MAEFPALPLFTDAYLGDTTHLTTFEHGAYLLLLMIAWRSSGCCLPDDDALLARYSKTTLDKWRKLRPIIQPFFSIREGHWHQARLQDEFRLLQSRRDQQREAGLASSVAKAMKRKARGSTTVGFPLQRNVNGTATPTPTPTPIISEPNGSLPALQPEHVFEAYNEMAERNGLPVAKKMTKTRSVAVKGLIRDYGLDDFVEAIAAIERSTFLRGEGRNGWSANFDFMIRRSNFQKLIEGNYDRPH